MHSAAPSILGSRRSIDLTDRVEMYEGKADIENLAKKMEKKARFCAPSQALSEQIVRRIKAGKFSVSEFQRQIAGHRQFDLVEAAGAEQVVVDTISAEIEQC